MSVLALDNTIDRVYYLLLFSHEPALRQPPSRGPQRFDAIGSLHAGGGQESPRTSSNSPDLPSAASDRQSIESGFMATGPLRDGETSQRDDRPRPHDRVGSSATLYNNRWVFEGRGIPGMEIPRPGRGTSMPRGPESVAMAGGRPAPAWALSTAKASSKDYEGSESSSESRIYVAMSHWMLRHLDPV